MLLDGHFLIEHAARHRSGCFFNFNGTAGIWRREAIDDAGGWQHDTLTEDLDLSYRAQLARLALRLPARAGGALRAAGVDLGGFKSQQHRWAKGSIQTARKLLARILARAAAAGGVKLEAFVHLTANVSYLLMVLLALLIFPAMLRAARPASSGRCSSSTCRCSCARHRVGRRLLPREPAPRRRAASDGRWRCCRR